MNNNYAALILAACLVSGSAVSAVMEQEMAGMQPLSDNELSEMTGQALFNLSYLAPGEAKDINGNLITTSSNSDIGFYNVGVEAEVELNANIRNLQLGCGGVNNSARPAACDIDIKNLSLSGLPSNFVSGGVNDGSPDYSADGGRAATSALLTNPFIEFAVKNPNSATLREIVGARFGAAEILGMLTAGTVNGVAPIPGDGIQSLSGYLQIAGTTGEVTTQQSTFGDQANERISGLLDIALFGDYDFTSNLGEYTQGHGITVPSMNVGFTLPSFTVTGQRLTTAVATNVSANIPEIPLSPGCGENGENCPSGSVSFDNDQLGVDVIPCVEVLLICTVDEAIFKMGNNSSIKNLKLDVTFAQSLSMFHNIPLRGSGGYLSVQGQAVHWPGANADDIAQNGWWMSFKEPVDLGYLKATNQVDISAVLPQVATLITQELQQESNRIYVDFGEALGAVFSVPIVKTLNIDVGTWTTANPAQLTLSNEQLTSQAVVANCWGSSSFC